MSKYNDKFMDGLTDIYTSIMKKCVDTGEVTEADLIFISMYQKQLDKFSKVPFVKQLINTVKGIIDVLNSDEETDDNGEEEEIDGI